MELCRHFADLPRSQRGAVVALGNFDGVHRGHQALIAEARAVAAQQGRTLAVMTFEPHPRQLFRPDDPPFRLTGLALKAVLLGELGVQLMVAQAFDQGFADKSAEAFIDEVLVSGLGAAHIVAGHDFRFGHDRLGSMEMLEAAANAGKFGVTPVGPARDAAGEIYSSSRVRDALRAGDAARARDLLGRPFEVEGPVLHGDKRGRELGYPTANMALGPLIRPKFGVYAIRAGVTTDKGLTWHDGVANLGIRPMFASDEPLMEAHLFDFDGDLYGRSLRVQLIERLRGEDHFDSLEALIAQMDRDSAAARQVLAR